MDPLDKLKSFRLVVRQSSLELVEKIDHNLSLKILPLDEIENLEERLIEKKAELDKINEDIEDLVDMDDLEEEVLSWIEFKDKLSACRSRIKRKIGDEKKLPHAPTEKGEKVSEDKRASKTESHVRGKDSEAVSKSSDSKPEETTVPHALKEKKESCKSAPKPTHQEKMSETKEASKTKTDDLVEKDSRRSGKSQSQAETSKEKLEIKSRGNIQKLIKGERNSEKSSVSIGSRRKWQRSRSKRRNSKNRSSVSSKSRGRDIRADRVEKMDSKENPKIEADSSSKEKGNRDEQEKSKPPEASERSPSRQDSRKHGIGTSGSSDGSKGQRRNRISRRATVLPCSPIEEGGIDRKPKLEKFRKRNTGAGEFSKRWIPWDRGKDEHYWPAEALSVRHTVAPRFRSVELVFNGGQYVRYWCWVSQKARLRQANTSLIYLLYFM